MRLVARILPQTVTGQITGLVIASLVAASLVTFMIVLLFSYESELSKRSSFGIGRVIAITKLAKAAKSPEDLSKLLEMARESGMGVRQIPLPQLAPSQGGPSEQERIADERLEHTYGVKVLRDRAPPAQRGTMVVRLDQQSALVFDSPPLPGWMRFLLVPGTFVLVVFTLFILFIPVYAVRWITAPLSSIAAAAHSFGRPTSDDRILSEEGPKEVAQVARAMNHMRERIRAMIDDRTRMLAAISHDLRTPLTRLRLRTEQLPNPGIRDQMLRDIGKISGMLAETLTYLREDDRSEPMQRVELPSLLQTICTDFSDMGHQVSYHGPDRCVITCRRNTLMRAITNVVENGVKNGTLVDVRLSLAASHIVQIDISDDGPGIPESQRQKVFEPFFKSDSARTSTERSGFGLGLSIARDVVRRHQGEIALLDRAPTGLTVRICLPASHGRERSMPLPNSSP
jgi:signal transduction histidine kinase